MLVMVVFFIAFFFQAEDGIRVLYVTGVQTCALPISFTGRIVLPSAGSRICISPTGAAGPALSGRARRSEERRVGKECRTLWRPYHLMIICRIMLVMVVFFIAFRWIQLSMPIFRMFLL